MMIKIPVLICAFLVLTADVAQAKKGSKLSRAEKKLLRLLLSSCEVSDDDPTTRRPSTTISSSTTRE